MADRTGQQLGNYRIIRQLGKGGFADVYLGEHIYLNTKAAIKVLQTRLDDTDLPGFLNEARTIAGLAHHRIVRILDFGVEDDTPFLVMEYAPYGTLRQRHPRGIRLPLVTIVPYVKQVAEALQYAHDRRLIHRDIKPENMLLNQQYEVLLSDFGIAMVSQTSRQIETQPVVGTAAYMAPEQLQGKPRPASDLYALGIVVYEWLTGDLPFHGTFTEVASQHLFVPPAPLRSKIPDIAHDVEQVMQIALAKDPQQRFMSVQAFAMALEQASASPSGYLVAPSDNFPTELVTPSRPPIQMYVTPPPPPPPNIYYANAADNLPNVVGQVSQPGLADSPAREPQPSQKGMSRRMVLVGLAGLVVGVGITGVALSQRFLAAPSSHVVTPTTAPTGTANKTPVSTPSTVPTSTTLGNIIDVYRGHTGIVYSAVWSPNGGRIASCGHDKTVQVWDATTGGNVLFYRGNTNLVYDVWWSSDGQYIASGGEDKVVNVWNAATTGDVSAYTGHAGPIYTVVWSPRSSFVASGGKDKTVQVWDGPSASPIHTYTGHTDTVRTVAWSPDGTRIASASEDKTVQVWDATTGQNAITYTGHADRVLTVAWSPDGKRIVSGSWDTTVHIWDAFTTQTYTVYRGHTQRVWSVAYSPDGMRIASAGRDNTVQIWNPVDGKPIYTYLHHTDTVWYALWSPDGRYIASSSNDGTVQVWSAI
jgi:WD40 repeat protein